MSVSPISTSGARMPAPVSASSTRGAAASESDKSGFSSTINEALTNLEKLHSTADQMASRAATGDLRSVSDYVVAATEAQLATQVTTAVRNKAVEAFNDIMRMPV